MKLAAIYNVFDGEELLDDSINLIHEFVDEIIIVVQDISNFGEHYIPRFRIPNAPYDRKLTLITFDPRIEIGPQLNETAKRNLGLDVARQKKCTHFIHMDCDEYYEDFGFYKKLYQASGKAGSVCKLWTYFRKPTLMMYPPEGYYVPFIHRLREDTVCGYPGYKFYVDPTRSVNETDVVELPFFMHHFSWVRKDIYRKARNSSANVDNRLENNAQIFEDYHNKDIGEGFYLRNWDRMLIEVANRFNIPEL